MSGQRSRRALSTDQGDIVSNEVIGRVIGLHTVADAGRAGTRATATCRADNDQTTKASFGQYIQPESSNTKGAVTARHEPR